MRSCNRGPETVCPDGSGAHPNARSKAFALEPMRLLPCLHRSRAAAFWRLDRHRATVEAITAMLRPAMQLVLIDVNNSITPRNYRQTLFLGTFVLPSKKSAWQSPAGNGSARRLAIVARRVVLWP